MAKADAGRGPARARAARVRDEGPPRPLDVFISHSSHDVALAGALVDLLRAALRPRPETIRCTSVPGYQLEGGADVNSVIRREAVKAGVFIAVVTPASLASPYVLFELGARWGLDELERSLIPLVAGMEKNRVPMPLSSLHLIDIAEAAQVHQVVAQVGKTLGVKVRRATDYLRELDEVTELAAVAPPAISKHEGRLLRALFGEPARDLKRFLSDPSYMKAIGKLLGKKLVDSTKGGYILTEKGKRLTRELFLAS
jgi:hypothetical protein